MKDLGYERSVFIQGNMTPLRHDFRLNNENPIDQFFMPREFFGEIINYYPAG
jgi:hypothetical protein